MNITDFGSTFRKHGPDHERFYMLTTYQQSFDRTENPTAQEVIEKDGKKLTSFAGYNVRPEHLKGIKMTSALTGEVFKSGELSFLNQMLTLLNRKGSSTKHSSPKIMASLC